MSIQTILLIIMWVTLGVALAVNTRNYFWFRKKLDYADKLIAEYQEKLRGVQHENNSNTDSPGR